MASKTRVDLIPWDPDSSDHVSRLVQQRLRCGWHEEKPKSQWKSEQRSGVKCIYWIALSDDDPKREELQSLHFDVYPEDKPPLQDTGITLRGLPREPTRSEFVPIGHISLDSEYPDAVAHGIVLDLPSEGLFWIKTFWISEAMRGQGLGRAAMDQIERMAVEAPLYAKVLALDTIYKLDHHDLQRHVGKSTTLSNHEWYERRGYQQIHVVPNFYPGVYPGCRTVFMKRDVL